MTQAACLRLAGPTACGKSDAALAIAARFARLIPPLPVEIVSVDSAQVYRGMDIGTAKPGTAERAAVPHHLLDLADPRERYSAAHFVADATGAIEAIRGRGALPLLVGGTMLYFKALADGLAPMPAADPALRAAIDADAAARGWPALHAELATVDPATAARLQPNDAQRIQRALEVWRSSGRSMSDWHRDAGTGIGKCSNDGDGNRGDAAPMISLEPGDRAWLHARIEARFRAMLDAGLVDEVRRLHARGDLDPSLPSMRAVGYRQAWAALDAGDIAPLFDRGTAATRQLAKRQLTWLRSLPARHVVACDGPGASEAVVELALRLVGAPATAAGRSP